MTTDIKQRLGGLRIEIAPATAGIHQAAIAAELRSPSAIPPRRFRRRRLPMVLVTAALLVILSAAGAVAAERSVPGDRLYPVKQATEWMRTWVDRTVPADHRIDELDTLIDRSAEYGAILEQLRRAEDAVAEASVGDPALDAPLVDQLDRVRDRVPPPQLDRPDEPVLSDEPIETSPIEEEVHEPDQPPVDRPRNRDGGGDALADHRAELATWCKEAVAKAHAEDREMPPLVKRRCHRLFSTLGDGRTEP